MNHSKVQRHHHLPAFILLRLARGAAHGGAIYNDLIREVPAFQCDTAAIYRTLRQLEKDGAVGFSWDTGHPGPARKIYTITEQGWQQLAFWEQVMIERIEKLTYFTTTYQKLTENPLRGE